MPALDLKTVLPNLPRNENEADAAIDMISRFLRYPFADRLKASDALNHPWLRNDIEDNLPQEAASWFQ